MIASPAAKKWAAEKGIDLSQVKGTGRDGRITKEDVVQFKPVTAKRTESIPAPVSANVGTVASPAIPPLSGERIEKRVPMTRMRARIAERLLQVTQQRRC